MFNTKTTETTETGFSGRVSILPEQPAPYVLDAVVYKVDLCRWLGKSPVTIWRWIKSGDFPAPKKLGQYDIWPAEVIAAWARERGLLLCSGIRHLSN